MDEFKRQSPGVIIVKSIRPLSGVVGLIVLLYTTSGFEELSPLLIITLTIYTLIGIGSAVAHWWSIVFSLTEQGIQIKGGIVKKFDRQIDSPSIQVTEIEQSPLQQVLGLSTVKIETQSGTQKASEALLDGLPVVEAEKVKKHLENLQHESSEQAGEQFDPRLSLAPIDLFTYALCSGRWTVLIFLVYAAYQQLPTKATRQIDQFLLDSFLQNDDFFVIAAVVASIFISWIASTIWESLKYLNFTVSASEKSLRVSYGLFHKYNHTIPYEGVRSIQVQENIFQQLFGVASIYLEVNTSLTEVKSTKYILIPSCPVDETREHIEALVPDFPISTAALFTPPVRAIHRYMIPGLFKGAFIGVILAGLLGVALSSTSGISLVLVTALIFVIFGYQRWKYNGFAVDEKSVRLRQGSFNLRTYHVPRQHVKGLQSKAHLFQRLARVSTIDFLVSTGMRRHSIKHMDEVHVLTALHWIDPYSYFAMSIPPELVGKLQVQQDSAAEDKELDNQQLMLPPAEVKAPSIADKSFESSHPEPISTGP